MDDQATLSDLARAEIDRLTADGIELTAEDIVRLNALAWRVEEPETRRLLSRGRPVFVGGATLWPLTIYALEFLSLIPKQITDFEYNAVLGYAMCHGRSENGELDASGREAVKQAVAWYKTLRCTQAEYAEAIRQIDAQETNYVQGPDDKPMALGDFSAFLAAACGNTPDYWERRCACGYALAVLSTVVQQNRADDRPSKADPRLLADHDLGAVIDEIRKRANQ